MSLIQKKRKLEKERAIEHYHYMKAMGRIEEAEETIKRLQEVIPEWKVDASEHKRKRDTLDKRFVKLFGKKFLETDETKSLEKDLKEFDRLKRRLEKLAEIINEKGEHK